MTETTTRDERIEMAQAIVDAASDDDGTIQAEDMVRLTGNANPTLHTATNMWRAAHLLGCTSEVADIVGFEPDDE